MIVVLCNWANSVDLLTKILSVLERHSASNAAAGSGADSLIYCSASASYDNDVYQSRSPEGSLLTCELVWVEMVSFGDEYGS